jgi:RNA ligase (TIGR02306 family)
MSNFRVSKQKIALFTHPNADALMLGRVGSYQVVVQKGLYNDGDEVIFAPEKSVLTGQLKTEYEKYLSGPNKDRVKAVRLRGEISSGIIIPNSLVPNFDQISLDEDVAELLGITKYEPPIPDQLAGKVKSFDMPFIGHHDCEHAGVYVNELIDGERVIITEKLHGSQFILAHNLETGETIVSSKGQLKKGLVLEDAEGNSYWEAAKNDGLVDKIKSNWSGMGIIQVFGEVVPIQSGYSYGQTKPTARLFDIRFNGDSIPYDMVPEVFKTMWVPVIFDGTLTLDKKEVVVYSDPEKGIHKTKIDYLLPKEVVDLCKGMELVSGKTLHIREGVVLRPYIDRKAIDGTLLRLKIINPAYKETGEEIN